MKILFHGDSPTCTTGFGTAYKNLLDNLCAKDKDLEVTVLGINDRGGYKDPGKYPYKIYPAIYDDYTDVFGFKRLLKIINGDDPEVKGEFDVIVLGYDFWLLTYIDLLGHKIIEYLYQYAQNPKRKTKLVIYTPIDNDYLPKSWQSTLNVFDQIVVPSEYGRSVIGEHSHKLASKTVVVPYAIDTKNFSVLPADERAELRKGFIAENDINKKFVIGIVGRNQWRKDYYHAMEIFSKFHRKHPDSFLYIHAKAVETAHDGGNLLELADRFGLKYGVDFVVPPNLEPGKGVERQHMNKVYNLLDVHLSATTGEGLGMPMVEAMLAGVVNVVPDNTTMPELMKNRSNLELKEQMNGRGFVYATSNTVCFGAFDYMRVRPLADSISAVKVLEFVYQHQKELSALKEKAIKYANTYESERVASLFREKCLRLSVS